MTEIIIREIEENDLEKEFLESLDFLRKASDIDKNKAYDILNENTNVYQFSGADSITSYESTALTQYFMLSFSYRFDTFHKNRKSQPGRVRHYRINTL